MAKNGSLYSAAYDFSRYPSEPLCSIMIAATPRSGSTFLGLELWRTGDFGAPLEYLNLARRADMLPRLGNGDYLKYWCEVRRVRTSDNGVFSFKAFVSDFKQVNLACPRLLSEITSDHVVYLQRRDKLGQAISFTKAMQTDRWYSIVNAERPAFYSKQYIDQILAQLRGYELSWERIFNATRCEPLRVFYEDFVDNPEQSMKRIFDFCRVDPRNRSTIDLPKLSVQRNAESLAWRSTYLSERKGEGNLE